MLIELGQHLRQIRSAAGRSLESVAGPAQISAAYLHKLEAGTVNNPSPRVLARIAVQLDLSYLDLMQLAGYLDEEQRVQAKAKQNKQPHPLAKQQLSAAEWKAVGAFIKSLIAQRQPHLDSSTD